MNSRSHTYGALQSTADHKMSNEIIVLVFEEEKLTRVSPNVDNLTQRNLLLYISTSMETLCHATLNSSHNNGLIKALNGFALISPKKCQSALWMIKLWSALIRATNETPAGKSENVSISVSCSRLLKFFHELIDVTSPSETHSHLRSVHENGIEFRVIKLHLRLWISVSLSRSTLRRLKNWKTKF